MTSNDYVGATLSVILAILIFTAYVHAFRPGNKDKFKKYGNIPNDED